MRNHVRANLNGRTGRKRRQTLPDGLEERTITIVCGDDGGSGHSDVECDEDYQYR